MRQNDGLGSDNMTVIIIDFLQNNGGCNSGQPGAKKAGISAMDNSKKVIKRMGKF